MEENLKEKNYLLEKIQDLEEKLRARDLENSSLKKISDDQQTEITVLTNENTKLKSIIKSQTEEPEKISQSSQNIDDRQRTNSAGSSGSILSSQASFLDLFHQNVDGQRCPDLLCGVCQSKSEIISREGFRVSGFRI